MGRKTALIKIWGGTPILVANTEWPLPENLLKDIKAERMINGLLDMACPNTLEKEDLVGWAECIGYLMPATSRNVLPGGVVEIYMYCVRKYLESKKKVVPDIGLPMELSDYQMKKLRDYKRWIFEQRGGKEKNPILIALKKVFFDHKEKRAGQMALFEKGGE